VAIYYCPLDLLIGHDQDDPNDTYPRRRGNYVVNWGNAIYDSPPPVGSAPFATSAASALRRERRRWRK